MRESNLLQHIYRFNDKLNERITIPPGDDMGAVRLGDRDVLVTVDQLVDGVHFRLDETPLEKIARKAITRNLSDVAAMAALPMGAVVAGCLPRSFGEPHANALFDAMRQTAAAFDCPLIGGDIAMWDQGMVLTVTVFAEADGVEPVRRSDAQVGDALFVTGKLGGSLEVVRQTERGSEQTYIHHLDFEPRITVARSLATNVNTRPRCMLDLSDGLATDLPRIVNAAEQALRAVIDIDALPISTGCHVAAKRTGRAEWEHAISDGEDYELCMVVAPEQAAQMPTEIDGVPITRIGSIVERDEKQHDVDVLLKFPNGTTEACRVAGWEHHD